MQTAEIHSAFVFDCDNCGRENMVRAIEATMGDAAAKRVASSQVSLHYDTVGEVREDGTVDAAYVITRVCIAPPQVECAACGTRYKVDLWSDDKAEPA